MAQKFLFILLIKISILIFISMLFFVTKIINRENAKEISIQEKFQDNKIRIDVRKKFEMNTNEPMNNVQIGRKLLRGHRVKRAARENQWKNEYAKRQKTKSNSSQSVPTAVTVGKLRFAKIKDDQVTYYHFSPSATLVKEDRKEKTPSETEQQFPSGLSGSIKIPEQSEDPFYFFFKNRRFCKRKLTEMADSMEFDDPGREVNTDSLCTWYDNKYLIGCESSNKKIDLLKQFCEDPFITGIVWLNKKLNVFSNKWLFIFDGVYNGESYFGDLIEGGIDSEMKWERFNYSISNLLWSIQNKLIVLDENDKVSRWDANGGLEAENNAAESVRDEQKFLEQAGQVKINAIIKQKNHEFYVIKNDELIEFNKQEKGWNFKNDDKMSLKQIEDKLGEHPPRKLTARIDRLPMGNVIYFKQKTFCKTAFLINAKNCHFQDNKNLLKCKSISKDYKNNIDLMHGIQQLCRSPNITLAFNAPNDTVYLFRFKQYWVFGMDKQQAIGDLISGPYDATETWKGWRLDNDGFFYDEKKFIMFYQNKWWSWKEDGQPAVTESALYEGEHLDAEEREKMKQEKEQKKQKEKEKREKEEEKRREEERKQRADKEKKKYEERQKKRKNGPEVDKTALKHLCWDLNIADGDIDMNNDLYVFKDEFYWKLEHQNGEFFVTKQGQSKNKWKKFQPNPSAVARIIEPGQRRGHFYEFYELNLYNYLMSWDSGDDIDKEKLYYAQPYYGKHFDAVFHDHLGNKSMVYGFEEDNIYYYQLMPTYHYDFYKQYQKPRNKNDENFPVDVIAAWMMKNGDIYFFNRNEEYCIRRLQCNNNETKCCDNWMSTSELFGCDHLKTEEEIFNEISF